MPGISFREADITKEKIQKILASGANVILTTGGIDDMCLNYFVDAGAMAVRRVLKKDLKRIAKASGGNCRNVHAKYNSIAQFSLGGGEGCTALFGLERLMILELFWCTEKKFAFILKSLILCFLSYCLFQPGKLGRGRNF